jgi:hypothetical protein
MGHENTFLGLYLLAQVRLSLTLEGAGPERPFIPSKAELIGPGPERGGS